MKRDTDFNAQPAEHVKEWYREFIFGYLEPDGIFMLRLLSSNTSDFVCTEVIDRSFPLSIRERRISLQVINQLWQAYYTKDPKQLKRKRTRDLGGESHSPEIKRQMSDPVDLSESCDSIRRRSVNFPPLPPSNLSDRVNNNGYGPLISSTNHHRISLTTGKQSSLSTLVEGDVQIIAFQSVFIYSQISLHNLSQFGFLVCFYISSTLFFYIHLCKNQSVFFYSQSLSNQFFFSK